MNAYTRLLLLMDLVNHPLKAEVLLVVANVLGLMIMMRKLLELMCAGDRCRIVCAGGDLFVERDRGGMRVAVKIVVVVSTFSGGCSTRLAAHFGHHIVFMLLDSHTDCGPATVPCSCVIQALNMTHHCICILCRKEKMLLWQEDVLSSSCEELLFILSGLLSMRLELR